MYEKRINGVKLAATAGANQGGATAGTEGCVSNIAHLRKNLAHHLHSVQ